MQELLKSGDLGYYRALFYLKGRIVDLSGKKKKSDTAMTPDQFVERMNARNG